MNVRDASSYSLFFSSSLYADIPWYNVLYQINYSEYSLHQVRLTQGDPHLCVQKHIPGAWYHISVRPSSGGLSGFVDGAFPQFFFFRFFFSFSDGMVETCFTFFFLCSVGFLWIPGKGIWESYRTSRSFVYGYGSGTELTEVPRIVARAYGTHRRSGQVTKKFCTRTPGICCPGVQNFQKFRVRV